MIKALFIVVTLLLAIGIVRYRVGRKKTDMATAALLEQSEEKVIRITDRSTGQDLGVMKNTHFAILVPVFANLLGGIDSFRFQTEDLEWLVEEKVLSSDLVQYLYDILGGREEVDLIWEFEPRA